MNINHNIINTIKRNFSFLFPYVLFLLIVGSILCIYPKGSIHLFINKFHDTKADYFFSYSTILGDGLTTFSIVLILCFIKFRYAFLMGISNILASSVTQLLKHTYFDSIDRPVKYFDGISKLHLVPWEEVNVYNSFPSGHATTAFATCFCLALMINKNWIKFMLLVLAITIGFSRVYLSQHFLNDVYAGSIVGITSTLLVDIFIFQSHHVQKLNWMNGSLLQKK